MLFVISTEIRIIRMLVFPVVIEFLLKICGKVSLFVPEEREKTMGKIFVFSANIIIILMLGHLSHGRLVRKPENLGGCETVIPDMMMCSSDIGSNAIIWYFIAFDTTNNVTVAVGGNVSPVYTNLFTIDQPNSYSSNLIFSVASSLTAGTYTCSDSTEIASAQFSVMSVDFEGNTNLSSSTKNGDVFYYSGLARFYGNDFIIIQMILMRYVPALAYNVSNPEITKIGSLRYSSGIVVRTATCGLQFPGVQFDTFFSEPRGNLPIDSATNAPTIRRSTTYRQPINVLCVPADENIMISGLVDENFVFYGQTINCSVPSSTPVNYTWTDQTYGNTSQGQQLRVWHSGTYQCNTSAEQGGKIYSASRTLSLRSLIEEQIHISLSASPLFGPIAGGTRIAFIIEKWSNQIANISAVYIGYNLGAAIEKFDKKSKLFVAITPATTGDAIQQPLQITLEFTPGPFNFTTDLYFTYRSNPEITNLYPNSFIITGGTAVYVTGSSLSSVSDPFIRVTLSVTRVNATENLSKTTNDSCKVVDSNGTEMICKMPPVDMPKDFLDILDSNYLNSTISNKVKTNSSVLEVAGPNLIDRAIVYLGFIFDGYRKYENINNGLPDSQISYYSSPEISSLQKVYEYDPGKEELFLIQGNHMTLGCRVSDYVVRVGNHVCDNVGLQDNALTVRLPKQEPQLAQNGTIICGDYLNARIIIGYKEYHYCCLKYMSSLTVLIIAVCVGVGGFLLVVFTIIGVICCCRIQRRGKPSNNHSNSQRQHSEVAGQSHEEFQDTSRTNDGYLRSIEHE